jgi:hypothetical protein
MATVVVLDGETIRVLIAVSGDVERRMPGIPGWKERSRLGTLYRLFVTKLGEFQVNVMR